jgi:hypothetical protein
MFQPDSRYYDIPELSVRDRQGVVRHSAAPRLRSPAYAEVKALHIVRQNDRLDNLAYEYFQDSRAWWKIADANPEFPSPRELLGDAVFENCTTLLGAPETWRHSEFERELTRQSGVIKSVIFSVRSRGPRRYRLRLVYNRLLFSETALRERLARDGCEILEFSRDERIGRNVRIPEL